MNEKYKMLVASLKIEYGNAGGYPTIDELEEELNNPKWEDRSRVHDWRNYIPEEVQLRWDNLHKEAQIIAWFMSNDIAEGINLGD